MLMNKFIWILNTSQGPIMLMNKFIWILNTSAGTDLSCPSNRIRRQTMDIINWPLQGIKYSHEIVLVAGGGSRWQQKGLFLGILQKKAYTHFNLLLLCSEKTKL
jgi:hypothetical protein